MSTVWAAGLIKKVGETHLHLNTLLFERLSVWVYQCWATQAAGVRSGRRRIGRSASPGVHNVLNLGALGEKKQRLTLPLQIIHLPVSL